MTREQHLYIKSRILDYKKSFGPFFKFLYAGILTGAIYNIVDGSMHIFALIYFIIVLCLIFYFESKIGSDMLKSLKQYKLNNVPVNMEELLANPVFRNLF